ncbi:hypothetical protein J1605_018829 [Eschrichtius robustus]|uniref:Regulator of G-protein signaling 8 n=1 Tax=Eschrichtius robustus TaxID=9764 RepID=A0AB34HT43_ESCRO|nr:hypothetical protein J1605_018829 [Eschrichtius robustus]
MPAAGSVCGHGSVLGDAVLAREDAEILSSVPGTTRMLRLSEVECANYGQPACDQNWCFWLRHWCSRTRRDGQDGVAAFRAFLKTEFSEENLEFWLACEEFKKTRSTAKLVSKAHRIFEEFVDVQAPREVNIDFQTREATRKNMQEPSLTCFDQAQGKVHSLMEKDSYPRFLRSKMYLDLLSQSQRRLS